jgi:hypothetical protein
MVYEPRPAADHDTLAQRAGLDVAPEPDLGHGRHAIMRPSLPEV